MKKWIFVFIPLFLGIIFLFILTPYPGEEGLISPVLKINGNVGLNQWFPKQVLGIFTNAPSVSANAAFFIDTKSGNVLFAKNSKEKLPIASLVKVMTVLIALEHKSLDDQFLVSQRATEMEPDEMILLPGETLTLRELLDGIFLVSANDAAEVLAEGSVGTRDEFIQLMNEKAKQLGMKDTFYANPTGLDEDSGNSYSSAYDLAILTRFLIKQFPEVVDISSVYHIYLPQTDTHQDYDMYSGINLLTTYPGVVGFKTGYTPEAGLTLVTLARKNDSPRSAGGAGHEIIGVLLGSGDRRDEARDLLDYSFGKLR